MKDVLYQYNPWWEEDFVLNGIIPRRKYQNLLEKNLENKHIIILTGLRRVGKTTSMKILISYLLNSGVDPSRIFYVSLDDYLLREKNLFEILEEYRKIHKIPSQEKSYVFFDEITHQKDYLNQLKNFYDTYNLKIFASASSSSLLKDGKAFLTGRSFTFEIEPLDFEEFKEFKGIQLKQRDSSLNEAYFRDFIRVGGMPENVIEPHREYLMNLVDDIIQKDITAYYGLKNHQVLRDYFLLLMERSGKQLSLNKVAHILGISPDTSRRYLSYFQETYLVHLVPRFGKTNETRLVPKKIYASDLGIKHLFTGDRDLGSYFENYIYLLLRNQKQLYYLYEDGLLIESKFNSTFEGKQKELFNRYPARKKLLIESVNQLDLLQKPL